jgi:hypothetical protein
MQKVLSKLKEVTKNHPIRASGVMSSHAALAAESEAMAFRKSAGTVDTVVEKIFLVIELF